MKRKVSSSSVHIVRCYDCANANIIDKKNGNPIIAEFKNKPDSYTGQLDRDVAMSDRLCKLFKSKIIVK